MIKFLGSRGASAVLGIFMLAAGSSGRAQNYGALNVPAAVKALDVDSAARPLGNVASTLARPAVAATTAVATLSGAVLQAQPARSVTVSLSQSIATEAAWLYRAGWPLYALVDRYGAGAPLDEQGNCLAAAVYFEARGGPVEGRPAAGRVGVTRAASDRYPPEWCGVGKQPAQFSFVRPGRFRRIDTSSAGWGRAQGVARVGMANVVPSGGSD